MNKIETSVEFLARLDINGETKTMRIPLNANFYDVIRILQRSFNNFDLSYFEYLDDDNDNVIVSCDGDLQSVFLYYSDIMKKAFSCGLRPSPLQICAKCNTPERQPNLTIFLNGGMSPNEKECNSNTSSSKSNTGSIGGGMFIYTTTDDHTMQVSHSNIGSMSPMSEEARDTGQWLASPSLCEDNVYIFGEIGFGATGRVMRALNTLTQEVIAVKVIDLDMDREDTIKQQILSELAVLRVSKSPYIIEFYGAFFVDGTIYICTEFMDGYSLDRYGVIDIAVLAQLLVPLINGLVYLWTNKIIHRDVKPSNMLINTSGQVKLCDFGISKQMVHSIAKTYTGTVTFMSPERLQGDSYRISSDVWSLGISVFILGTGRHPFVDMNVSVTPALMMNNIYQWSGVLILPPSHISTQSPSHISPLSSSQSHISPLSSSQSHISPLSSSVSPQSYISPQSHISPQSSSVSPQSYISPQSHISPLSSSQSNISPLSSSVSPQSHILSQSHISLSQIPPQSYISPLSPLHISPLSPLLINFISHCLQKDPSQRLNPSSIVTHPIYQQNCGNHASELSQWVFDHSP